jgi:UDP-glucose 4-epimerase
VEYIFGDFRDSIALIEALVDVEVVYHLISATFPGTAALDPHVDVRDNILPTLGLLDAMGNSALADFFTYLPAGRFMASPRLCPRQRATRCAR